MIATTHPVAPEDVMALLDGELSSAEAMAVSTHIDHCVECAELVVQLRNISQSLSVWTVPATPLKLDEKVNELAATAGSKRRSLKPRAYGPVSFWNWRLWLVGGVGTAAVLLVFAKGPSIFSHKPVVDESRILEQREELQAAHRESKRAYIGGGSGTSAAPSTAAMNSYSQTDNLEATPPHATPPPSPAPAPMIARNVNLTIQVGDIVASRFALDAILARHHGYAAQITVNTPENDARSVQASLRIPAPEFPAAIAEIRTLGRVEVETQSGEEVTQQHADLVARLQNARETEQRLRDLLARRTGKIDEVLQVEEEIDRVRGEIENMEADQKILEHRVDFATVDLQLTEEYKEKFNPQPASIAGSMHNAFVAGLRRATGALLGIVLFLEEFGPVLLMWVVIIGVPAILGRRRYRKAYTKL